jgi:hypothetical protein
LQELTANVHDDTENDCHVKYPSFCGIHDPIEHQSDEEERDKVQDLVIYGRGGVGSEASVRVSLGDPRTYRYAAMRRRLISSISQHSQKGKECTGRIFRLRASEYAL